MKLLIVTQVVDQDHPILGFFHAWIEEFAKHCESVEVICLQAGSRTLPPNVHIHSLGKEDGVGRLTYLWRFYKYSWQLRARYEAVFVHMVPLYVLLGAPVWKFLRKKICLWYVHGAVEWPLRLAEKLVHRIFTAAPEGFNLKSSKVAYTGHGIDTTLFKPDLANKKSYDLIAVGRISPSKNLESLLTILELLHKDHKLRLAIIGAATDDHYLERVQRLVREKGLSEYVEFFGSVSQQDLPRVLTKAKLFVTAAQNGSLDKVVLEAMACDLPVVSMAPGTRSLPLDAAQVESEQAAAAKISSEIFAATHTSHRTYIENQHGLVTLIPKLISCYEK